MLNVIQLNFIFYFIPHDLYFLFFVLSHLLFLYVILSFQVTKQQLSEFPDSISLYFGIFCSILLAPFQYSPDQWRTFHVPGKKVLSINS